VAFETETGSRFGNKILAAPVVIVVQAKLCLMAHFTRYRGRSGAGIGNIDVVLVSCLNGNLYTSSPLLL
jgi:hypothetical protein